MYEQSRIWIAVRRTGALVCCCDWDRLKPQPHYKAWPGQSIRSNPHIASWKPTNLASLNVLTLLAKRNHATGRFHPDRYSLHKVNRYPKSSLVGDCCLQIRICHQQQRTMHPVTHRKLHAPEARFYLGTSCKQAAR